MREVLERSNPILKRQVKVLGKKVVIKHTGSDIPSEILTLTSNKEENLQGHHQDNLTASGDEASGLPEFAQEPFESTLTNPDSLLVWISNPTMATGFFADIFEAKQSEYQLYRFDCEQISKDHPELIDPYKIQKAIAIHGRDSDFVKKNILGFFPTADPEAVLSKRLLIDSHRFQKGLPFMPLPSLQRQIGIDFARFGGDECCVVARAGSKVVSYWFKAHVDPAEAVEEAFKMADRLGWNVTDRTHISKPPAVVVFDAGGMGQGLFHLFEGKRYCGVAFNERPGDPKYKDAITEAYFQVKERSLSRAIDLPMTGIVPDPILIDQLVGRHYKQLENQQFKLETKDQYKMRRKTGNSPDRADAYVLAFYETGRILELGTASFQLQMQ